MITLNKSLAISIVLHALIITVGSLNIFYRHRTVQWSLSTVELVNITSREITGQIPQAVKGPVMIQDMARKFPVKQLDKPAKIANLPEKPEKIFRRIEGPPKTAAASQDRPPQALPADDTQAGQPAISIEVQKFPFAYYLDIIKNKIDQNWRPQKGIGKAEVTVSFRIVKTGDVKDVAVEKSSGIFFLDQSAMRAIIQSGPFPSLPIGFSDEYLGVHLKFSVEEYDF
jgi:TonB family protein